MRLMPVLMGVGGDQRHKYFVVEEDYNCFYYLTNDHYGEIILRLLCEPDKKAITVLLNSVTSWNTME